MSSFRLAGVRAWSTAEIEADAGSARAEFRRRRLAEPLARYLGAFDATRPVVEQWVDALGAVFGDGADSLERLKALLDSEDGRIALRYLGAPPISEDDLETLAEAGLASAARSDDSAQRIRAVVGAILDPRRFPWLDAGLPPSAAQRDAAALATTALMASQRVQTLRRGDEKAAVEGAVRGLLVGMGWQAAVARTSAGIQKLLTDAPTPRTYLTQTNLGADNADLIVRLDDGRLLAVECKGSNSEINSRKRLNKEAVQNARAWLASFGADQVVPAVALQGVFKARYVAEAQDTPLAVFWSHRLDDLREFIVAAR